MDFSTMREKVAAGDYTSWAAMGEDMQLIFSNAMLYNKPDTIYHKQVRADG